MKGKKLPKLDIYAYPWLAIFLFTVIWFGFLCVSLPIYVWDVLAYHTDPVINWINAREIFQITTENERSLFFPKNFELLQTYVALFYKHEISLKIVEYALGLMVPLIAFSLFQTISYNRVSFSLLVIFAVSLFMTPAILVQLTASRNDLTVNTMILVSLLFSLKSLEPGNSKLLLISGLAAGFAIGCKPIALFMCFPIVLLAAMLILYENKLIRDFLLNSFYVSVVVMLSGSYWYLRNWYLTGHPTEPLTSSINGGMRWISLSTFSVDMINVFYKIFDAYGTYSSDLTNASGYGPFFFALLIPSYMYCLAIAKNAGEDTVHLAKIRYLLFIAPVCFVIMVPYITYSKWTFRYFSFFIFFPFAFSLLVITYHKCLRNLVLCLLFGSSIYAFVTCFHLGVVNDKNYRKIKNTPILDRYSANFAPYVPEEHKFLANNFQSVKKIGTVLKTNEFIHSLYDPYFAKVVIHCVRALNIDDVTACISKNNLDLIYISSNLPNLRKKLANSERFGQIHRGIFYYR